MSTGWIILALTISVYQCAGDIINIAQNKPASQSSLYTVGGIPAGGAVDGVITTVWPKVIHTAPWKPFAWWDVDLQSQVKHATVKVFFRTDYKGRRNGVQLYTSVTPITTHPGGQLCHTVSGRTDGTDIPDVVSVSCSGPWRYLRIYTQTANDRHGPLLDFGEVEVLVCSSGTYGPDCKTSNSSSSCDDHTGQCDGVCPPGWHGTNCTQVCQLGTYGDNCSQVCSSRHCLTSSVTCDRATGTCPTDGCEAGWRGADCTQICQSGTYGDNCSQVCSSRHCLTSSVTCDHATGTCPTDGCEAGWRGADCTQICQSGTYGDNCSQVCSSRHCLTSSVTCDHVNGTCYIDGCEAGWRGADCMQKCISSKYGANCVKACNDRQCRTPSSCCDHVTGQCFDGCKDGWTGTDCVDQCPKGTFGIDCLSCSMRHCQGESRCAGNGTCSGGCQDGWSLDNCTQVCSSGKYGPGCNFSCGNCADDVCHHMTGSCPGGCEAGWQGNLCQQKCSSAKHGSDCNSTCGNCDGDAICHHVTGKCEALATVKAYVIGSIIGIVLTLVVNGGVLICLRKHGRLQWRNASRSEDPNHLLEMDDVSNPHLINQRKSEGLQSHSAHVSSNDYPVFGFGTE